MVKMVIFMLCIFSCNGKKITKGKISIFTDPIQLQFSFLSY